MGIVMVHGKLPGDGGFYQNGRAADVILPEHIPVGEVLFHRQHKACEPPLRGHHLPGGGANHGMFLPDSLQLEPQLPLGPVVVRVQEGHIFSPGQGNSPVPGLGHPQILLIAHIADPGILPVAGNQPWQVIGGAIVHHNYLQGYLLPQHRVNGKGNIGGTVVCRDDHRNEILDILFHFHLAPDMG